MRFKVKKSAAQRRLELRDSIWPGADQLVWTRHKDDGYSTVPRTLPLIMTLMNLLEGAADASRVYGELWSRVSDEGFIELADDADHAYASGYVSPRGVRTWGERMQLLVKLGFIQVKPRGSRRYGYVLLIHPHDVVETLARTRDIPGGVAHPISPSTPADRRTPRQGREEEAGECRLTMWTHNAWVQCGELGTTSSRL